MFRVVIHTRTVNEWRDMQNLREIPDGDVYVAAQNLTAWESPADIGPEETEEEDPLDAAAALGNNQPKDE